MFFLLFLLDDRSIWIRISDKWIRIREVQKQYGSYLSGSATLVSSDRTARINSKPDGQVGWQWVRPPLPSWRRWTMRGSSTPTGSSRTGRTSPSCTWIGSRRGFRHLQNFRCRYYRRFCCVVLIKILRITICGTVGKFSSVCKDRNQGFS